ncbi:MAG: MBL fold metallo-hydrolase [Rhizobacter sp.]|nr:MBL fold metallo-hydrolase [Bacteriovorax sp.]
MIKFLAISALLCLGSVSYNKAMASAPMAKTQAPGFYRFMLGDFEVTALYDGSVALPMNKLLSSVKKYQIEKQFKSAHLATPTETPVNAYLINTGTKLILIDTGAAALFGPTLGKLLPNLKAAGYEASQVDEIYITHLHPDHVGGLFTDSKVSFPNAIVRADKRDIEYWLSKENMEKAPEANKGFFQGAMVSFDAYTKANKVQAFDGDTKLVEGIQAVKTYGHTPGHASYLVESKGQKLMVIGDLIHVGAVQFNDPTVTIAFDSDSVKAFGERMKIFTEVAKDGTIIGATHIAFPGLGRLRHDGKKFEWLPL